MFKYRNYIQVKANWCRINTKRKQYLQHQMNQICWKIILRRKIFFTFLVIFLRDRDNIFNNGNKNCEAIITKLTRLQTITS